MGEEETVIVETKEYKLTHEQINSIYLVGFLDAKRKRNPTRIMKIMEVNHFKNLYKNDDELWGE